MIRSLTLCVLVAAAAGCASQPQAPEPAPEPEPVVLAAPDPPKEAPAATVAATDMCAQLLESLEETKPLLAQLDEELTGQEARIRAAVAELRQPPPAPSEPDCPASVGSDLTGKEVIGAIEWLYMDPPGRHYRARVDSGAETSSLSASDILEYERDGDDWVRFIFQHDRSDEPVEIELPISRTVLIRQVSSDEPERRFVVEMDIRLGQRLQSTEFTLTDRGRMTYPVLLGRAFLMDLYVIDVSRAYTHRRYEAP